MRLNELDIVEIVYCRVLSGKSTTDVERDYMKAPTNLTPPGGKPRHLISIRIYYSNIHKKKIVVRGTCPVHHRCSRGHWKGGWFLFPKKFVPSAAGSACLVPIKGRECLFSVSLCYFQLLSPPPRLHDPYGRYCGGPHQKTERFEGIVGRWTRQRGTVRPSRQRT